LWKQASVVCFAKAVVVKVGASASDAVAAIMAAAITSVFVFMTLSNESIKYIILSGDFIKIMY
jgi:hypothetical protein